MSTFHQPETEAKSRLSMKSANSFIDKNMNNMEDVPDFGSSTNRIDYMADELVTPMK